MRMSIAAIASRLAALALAAAVSAPVVAAPAAAQRLVDINRADRKELMTLPGIGPAQAAAIVAHRPYLTKTELVSKQVLPMGPFLQIRHQVIALQVVKPPGGKTPRQAKAD
jgi:DNA uptake protein ComE-like DNA-binding protein